MEATEFRELRLAAGLSVRKAAERLGCAPSSIQRWESGERRIPVAAASALRGTAEPPGLAERMLELERRLGALERELHAGRR